MQIKLGKFEFSLGRKSVTATGNFVPSGIGTGNGYREATAEIYRTSSILVSCLRVIQNTFWEPRLRAYDKEGNELPNHRIQQLLDRPNPNQTQSDLLAQTAFYMAGWGNAFWVLARGKQSKTIKEIWCYSDDNVEPNVSDDGVITSYTLRLNRKHQVKPQILPIENVIHFKSATIDPDAPWLGISMIRMAMQEAGIDTLLTRMLRSYLRNGAKPGVVVRLTPGQDGLNSKEEREEFKAEWNQRYGGENFGATSLITGVDDITVLDPNFDKLKTDQLRYFSENRICGLLGVPPRLAGLGVSKEDSTYNNATTDTIDYTDRTLVPMWSAVEDKLGKLAEQIDPNVDICFDLSTVEALRLKRTQERSKHGDIILQYMNASNLPVANRKAAVGFVVDAPTEVVDEIFDGLDNQPIPVTPVAPTAPTDAPTPTSTDSSVAVPTSTETLSTEPTQ